MINHGEGGSGASCCHASLKIFHLTPKIFQLTLTSVRVSWAGLLESQECADSIIVKHYKGDFTSDFFMSDPLDVGTNSYIVRDIVPLQPYTYQVSMIACDITSQNRSCGKSWHSWRCFDHKLIMCGNILILYKQTPDQSYFHSHCHLDLQTRGLHKQGNKILRVVSNEVLAQIRRNISSRVHLEPDRNDIA